ncbi:hypothetical protein [Mesorhizobium sp. 113-3-3]|uniref:hypothetical protein n=1 Tax=Mesorhizobium sp. 113-3-3 TaxID=2744516 RepID=UPI001925FC7F|nr:hypothetical protein [Mesorhizobium sp. 113-3-3]
MAKGKAMPKKQSPQKAKAQSTRKKASVEPPKKMAQKENRQPNINLFRRIYLEAIIDAALRAMAAPLPPKRAREQLNAETLLAGGPVRWAKAQPEYQVTLERKQQRLASKAQAPLEQEGNASVVKKRIWTLDAPPKGSRQRPVVEVNRASVQSLCEERARLSTALAAAEADIRRHREAIAEIDRRLATASSNRR